MSGAFQIEGQWPATTTLRRGWGKATARLWNRASGQGALRLIRGNTAFLDDATGWTAERGGGVVLSPALYPGATRNWKRVGYQPGFELKIMERRLRAHDTNLDRISPLQQPDLAQLETIDRSAFDDFWHMDREGIEEALEATPRQRVFAGFIEDEMVGYAIIGAQLGVSFLQRIAVVPDHQGRGLGTEMIEAGSDWATTTGATTMLLNVRGENRGAVELYRSLGFDDTNKFLHVLKFVA